ncbi:MAG: bacitracin ABC transporter ATP-binding protein [Stygiobacter sp. RIFOXYA12_FULL_38_9]|nr:MAG: bacitracin ABC transporter ATP-binding protein [Stygiobacter sp. GWC2_38_9]OGU81631.1 MAG: bacitracin ABC transporter ATP-binding protein [Stygiobacter sp. RIFOXYA12_FULL_38_9]OGV08019.1 MAG: bacitracin ABC transporter ATP-binding protein [Stygiobacter sp. RIFOXYB2_FULL_37_11]OGV12247.1 MAG: bacitracin ABC transporter ATP-binding protein [Stygiobacter sp. RIFOXYA2_FULL_38_8]OGV14296.1 MAG: bacitracin ABC transporter ATP-binding protein [Stygiobacter sp. RIFOXYC2_FULL_38_25]OGV82426.1 M
MNSDHVIEVRGLTKRFKSLTAVNNLDLNVYRGDVFGFLGPNGAGKSTTIRMLLSLIKPNNGSIKIFGMPLEKNRNEILRKVGAIVEKPDFYMYLSAYKNLEILGKLSGADASKKKIMEMLELVGLEKRYKSKVKTFSHGMKQRLGIAQALLHDPELIILDEPTTGLDPQGMKEIRDLILYLSKTKNKTIFLSSHILREVEIIATRMIIISKGTTQVEGTVDELLNVDKMSVSLEVDRIDDAVIEIKNSKWAEVYKTSVKNEMQFDMLKRDVAELNRYLNDKGFMVGSVVPVRSLEDFFLKITEGGQK